MWTCQCPKTKRGRNKSTKQWKVIILLLVTLPLSRIVGVMVMEMAMVITDAMVTEKEDLAMRTLPFTIEQMLLFLRCFNLSWGDLKMEFYEEDDY